MRTDVKNLQPAQGAPVADVQPTKQAPASPAQFRDINKHGVLYEKFCENVCRIKNSVYLCIGKRTVQSTQDISYPQYSGVSGAVPFFGTVRLPKHKETSLPFCVHIK